MPRPRSTHFRVSSALKRLIGRDLITNPYVAVFELVKNAHDAGARRVQLVFEADSITIVDDGSGMSALDIREKWLFVAYSGKRPDAETGQSVRRGTRLMAGSKGVGRFAADQLGACLRVQTRPRGGRRVEVVDVAWDAFEQSQDKEFVEIPVRIDTAEDFSVPAGMRRPTHGTVLTVSNLREPWPREKLLKLRQYLTRLIDPFGDRRDPFEIIVVARAEQVADEDARRAAAHDDDGEHIECVNGAVESSLLHALETGTTSITVSLSDDGQFFETTLVDRGLLVYKLREPNDYPHLRHSQFDCRLFYLNQAAKNRFTRIMGVRALEVGSVFVFRNGFRVFPIGEPGNDFFGIDRRKQQGYARFLGTREVIGRLNVEGKDADFRESTSRDQGLIATPAVEELKQCVTDLVLRRLETYVRGVTWFDKLDKDEVGADRLQTAEARRRIVNVLAGLTRKDGVKLLAVAPDLDSLLSEQFADQEPAIRALEAIALNQDDAKLLAAVRRTQRRLRTLVAERARAEAAAEEARAAKEAADVRVSELGEEKAAVEAERDRVGAAYEEERARSLFFAAATPLDVEALQGFMHQIGLQTADVAGLAENALALAQRRPLDKEGLIRSIERILWRARQTLAVSKFATKANFRLQTAQVDLDLAQFFEEYIEHVASVWTDVAVNVQRHGGPFVRRTRPIDVSIVVDNLIGNARRARATHVKFDLSVTSEGRHPVLAVSVTDDGNGLAASVSDIERIFERGFTTTSGSGLGLWHVRHAMQENGGTITASVDDGRHLTFLLTFPK